MNRLKVGVIGCGYICSQHTENIKKCPKMRLIGVADINREAAEKMRELSGAEYATDDVEKLIKDGNIDALLVFSSHNTHAEIIAEICKAKKPFFVEKPLALTSAECRQIQTWVKATGIKNQVGYWMRHSPLIAKTAEVIPSPYFILARCLKGGGEKFNPQKMIREAEVTAKSGYYDQAGYLFDVILRLIPSEPVSIQSAAVSDKLCNSISSNLKFKNGAMATIINGDIGSGGYLGKWFFEIIGGTINATVIDFTRLVFSAGAVNGIENNNYRNGFDEQMNRFAEYVLDGGESPLDVRSASLPTFIMEKAVASARSKTTEMIDIKEVFD